MQQLEFKRPVIKFLGLVFVCAILAMRPRAAIGQNLLANGSFESPGLPSGVDYEYLDTQPNLITGWTVTYNDASEPSYYLETGHSPSPGTVISAEDGQYLLALSNGDSLYQTFNSSVGQQYRLTYYAAQPGTLEITVGNLDLMEYSSDGILTSMPYDNNGYDYSLYSADFTATSAESTLNLYNVGTGQYYGNFGLDNASVLAVPEPTSVSIIAVCSIALLARRFRPVRRGFFRPS